jgi:hypothetical protein
MMKDDLHILLKSTLIPSIVVLLCGCAGLRVFSAVPDTVGIDKEQADLSGDGGSAFQRAQARFSEAQEAAAAGRDGPWS